MNQSDGSPESESVFVSSELLVLIAVLLLGFILHWAPRHSSAFAIAATIAILAAVVAPRWNDRQFRLKTIAGSAVVVSLCFSVWGLSFQNRPISIAVLIVTLGVGAATTMMIRAPSVNAGRATRFGITLLLVGSVLFIANVAINHLPTPYLDTLLIHESAAEEISKGENPYITARAPYTPPKSMAAEFEGVTFEGYVYPPMTLLWFAGSDLAFGDPRWASAIAVSLFVALLVSPWSKMTTWEGAARIAIALMFVSLPYLGVIIWGAWTDLIALPLLLGAALLWRRYPIASAVLLGLALSTKPYFLAVLPLLLLWPSSRRWKRLFTVGAVVIATYVPFLLLDVPSVIRSLGVGTYAATPFRPDSVGLAGLSVQVPRALSGAMLLATGVILGRRGGSADRFFLAMAAVMAVAFLTSLHAFPNYWILVVGLLVIALAASDAGVRAADERDESLDTVSAS
jgi:hypothetical protein